MNSELVKVYLSLGSNEGNRLENMIHAIKHLKQLSEKPLHVSGVYETEPWGFTAPQQFYNIAVEMQIKLAPGDLISNILAIETELGRQRSEAPGYQSRIIDIDVLFFGEQIIQLEELTVPHPRMHLRRFVLEPLAELAPKFIHPLLGQTVLELINQCRDEGKVVYLMPFPWIEDII